MQKKVVDVLHITIQYFNLILREEF